MMKVDISSFVPIYEQIKEEIKRKISLGDLKPKEPLPSIRDLAEELLINPNTVARAYRELELEGFIYTRKGRGCYVSDDSTALVHKEQEAILNQIIDNAIEEAKRFNLTFREIKKKFDQRIDLVMDNKKKEEKGE